MNKCPLKGEFFDQEDLDLINSKSDNSGSTYDDYKNLLKKLRGKTKPTERAWIAGIIDGEGSLYIYLQQNNTKYRARIKVKSCTPLMQLKLIEIIQSGCIWNASSKNKKAQNSTIYELGRYYAMAAIIELTLPYLTVKKQIAKYVKEFCIRRLKKEPFSERDDIIYNKVKMLNARGIS